MYLVNRCDGRLWFQLVHFSSFFVFVVLIGSYMGRVGTPVLFVRILVCSLSSGDRFSQTFLGVLRDVLHPLLECGPSLAD